MKQVNEFKGYSAFLENDSDTVSFVSGRLSDSAEALPDERSNRGNGADKQRCSELQSLLLMASLMLGDRSAAAG